MKRVPVYLNEDELAKLLHGLRRIQGTKPFESYENYMKIKDLSEKLAEIFEQFDETRELPVGLGEVYKDE